MKNMRIRVKLLLGFGIVILLSAVLSVFAIFSLNRVTDNYKNVLDYSQQRIQDIIVELTELEHEMTLDQSGQVMAEARLYQMVL